ncbi:hypothetical protein [Streptomyces sp. NPDC096311]|uniref:hypothetical protein n=1 Tax=Streptomyces sp. NPDC096311 TaxID=3366083 RepID=UPI00380C341D
MIGISVTRSGRTHDITVARRDHLHAHLRTASLGALADLGFIGMNDDQNDPVVVNGFKATRAAKLTTGQKEANRMLASGRAASSTASRTRKVGGFSSSSAPIPPTTSTSTLAQHHP